MDESRGVGVEELGHLVLYVRNLQRSVAFYRDALGWRMIMPADGQALDRFAMFSGGRTHHELLLIEVGEQAAPIPQGRRVGLYHFGLKVGDSDDELRLMVARLREAGVPLLGSSDHGFTHSLYLADPDGNELELYVDMPGVDWTDPELLAAPARPLRL